MILLKQRVFSNDKNSPLWVNLALVCIDKSLC